MNESDAVTSGRVSIVVLNWNSGDLGRSAVASAVTQRDAEVGVIVVDNASTDDSLARILDAHPAVEVIRHDDNLGFARGMNAGIAAAAGEYVLPLNCDAELDPDYVATLLAVLETEPRAAAAGGLVRSSRVETSGPLAITTTMRTRALPVDRARQCDKLNGACPLFRAAALTQVVDRFGGPYDPTYDMYGEDVDLAKTLTRLGWTLHYEPSATAQHVRSYGSAPRVAQRRGRFRISTLANRHRNIVRHAPKPAWIPASLAYTQDAGFAALRALRGDLDAPRDVMQAWKRVHRFRAADRTKRAQLVEPGWLARLE